MKISQRHRLIVIGSAAASAMFLGSLPTQAQTGAPLQPEQACSSPTKSLSLFAERKGRNRIGYGLTPGNPRIPGPTIEMMEGDCLAVTLVNDTDKPLSMHAHGVGYTTQSDGTPLNDSCVAPGKSRTYVFEAHMPSTRPDGTVDSGTAGYWHYHDHCLGTEHGTGGVYSGLFGALIVRRPGDPVPDRPPCVITMIATTINLKKAPRTPKCASDLGQRVEWVVIGHGDLFHTFHLHAHRWADTRTGNITTLDETVRVIDNRTVGPADSFGFQIIAGEHVGPGAWMYHCHVQGHSDSGMEGIFVVRGPDGELTEDTVRALREWRRHRESHSH